MLVHRRERAPWEALRVRGDRDSRPGTRIGALPCRYEIHEQIEDVRVKPWCLGLASNLGKVALGVEVELLVRGVDGGRDRARAVALLDLPETEARSARACR